LNNPEKKIEKIIYKSQSHKIGFFLLFGKVRQNEKVINEINTQLKAHKLIKIKISSNDKIYRNQIQEKICKITNSVTINNIGKIFVIFKEEESS